MNQMIKTSSPPQGILDGFRVIDLTEFGCQLCGKVLGDLGADIIKIEPPGGSPTRDIGPYYHDIRDPEKSLFWFAYNTSKRGITLDLQTQTGRGLFRKLAAKADIVIESYPPGHLQDLSLSYEDLERINPGIILTSITPFGQTGPHAGLKGDDIVGWAMGGMMGLCGDNDRPPVQHSHPQSYYHAGIHGAMGTMTALYHREMTGDGQHVDVSMQQAIVLALMNAAETGELYGETLPRPKAGGFDTRFRSGHHGPIVFRYAWECRDGHIIWQQALAGGAQQGMVRSTLEIVRWMKEDGMAGDLPEYDWSRFDTQTVRQDLVDHHQKQFGAFLLTKTKEEILDRATRHGILLGVMRTADDICSCPQLAARNFFTDVFHPELDDTITYPGAWVKISDTPWRIRCRAPLIGEHNREIYCGELQVPETELLSLLEKGII